MARRVSRQDRRSLQEAALGLRPQKPRYLSAYLARRIHNLGGKVLSFVCDDATKGVLDGRVITLDKVFINELYR